MMVMIVDLKVILYSSAMKGRGTKLGPGENNIAVAPAGKGNSNMEKYRKMGNHKAVC